MNIWLVTIGEPIPHESNTLRLHRTGIISRYISEFTNHHVTWWTSDFNHFSKEHIFGEDTIFSPSNNLKIVAIHGRGYKRNISIDRIIDHKQISDKFKLMALNQPKPDIIVAAFPTLGLCFESLSLGEKWNIPVVIDYRDMWPEVFVEYAPKSLKKLIKAVLNPLFLKTNLVFRRANGIISITDEFLNLALLKIPRVRDNNDNVFPLAYLGNQFSQLQLENARQFWSKMLPRSKKLRISFLGTLGHQFDFDTIISAVKILNEKGEDNFEIVLCGSGDKEMELLASSKNVRGLYLPGYMSAAQIKALLDESDIGLCPYNTNEAFLSSIPGKAIEYLSFGLPILSTLEFGELGRMVNKFGLGFHYECGNPISLAEKISSIIENQQNIITMRDKILSVFKEMFDADVIYSRYVEHLENVKNQYGR